MPDKRASGRQPRPGGANHDRHALSSEERPRQYMPATALAAMRFADLTEPEKIVPEISVRIPSTAPCSDPVPCVGVREKRHSCGPSPPESKGSLETPCGLPLCFNEDICSCRCYCGLRKDMLRAEDEGTVPAIGEIDQVLPRTGTISKVHVARIHGLEPRGPDFHWVPYPRPQCYREHRRHYISRPPRYAHALLENKRPSVCRCPWHTQTFYVTPNGVREFWHNYCY